MGKEYIKIVSAVHLFLIKKKKILLLRRFNTGYEDGKYSVPAGHIEPNETATEAMIREAREEIGVVIKRENIRIAHVMHRKSKDYRIDFFFIMSEWEGEPEIKEKNKCDDLCWFSIDNLPQNIVPYVKTGMEKYKNKIIYSEFGWD